MKTRILLATALLFSVALTGCKEDLSFNDTFTLSSDAVEFDGNTLTFDPERQTVAIDITTESASGKWNAICPIEDLWCSIVRSGNKLMVTASLNNTGKIRSTWIEFSLDDNVKRIDVNQDYLRILSLPSSSVTIGAARHGEMISLTTNIALNKLTASLNPTNCDWIDNIVITATELTFNVLRNPSSSDTRTATITITGDGASVSLVAVRFRAILGRDRGTEGVFQASSRVR